MNNHYYDIIIVGDKSNRVDDLLNEFITKLKVSKEIASYNLKDRIVYTTDGSKFKFILRKRTSNTRYYGFNTMKVTGSIFKSLLDGIDPKKDHIIDTISNMYKSWEEQNK